jgi:hypothetical protein
MLRFVDLTAAIYPQDPDPAPRTCGLFDTISDRFLEAWGCHSLGDMEDVFEAGRAMSGSVAGGQRAQGLVPDGFFDLLTVARACAWETAAADMGLTIRRPSDQHVQFMQDGKVLADWWPSKGTTMMDGKRGPRCRIGESVVAWLKTA